MAETIKIPGYRIERKLGQGGMAAVHLAIQESFEREVALKIMSPLLNSDPSFTTRFIREARIVAHIHHASIVPVFDVGEHQPYHYLSMEYLPGGDLKQRILRGRCTPDQLVSVCVALGGALDVAHRKGYVHRDIKPENILFREDGTPVLTDFGIARAVDRGASLTVAGMMVGTPSYMSPEQVKGVELDGRSDLYSLGIVCYEMLTGNVPFRADSTMSTAIKHLIEEIPPLPADLARYQPFISRLTAKERNDRFACGYDAVQALRAIDGRSATGEATMLRPMPPEIRASLTKPPRRRYLTSAIATTGSAAARIASSVSRRWAARRPLPDLRSLWSKFPKLKLDGRTARWAGVAGVLVLVVAISTALILRSNPSAANKVAAQNDVVSPVTAADSRSAAMKIDPAKQAVPQSPVPSPQGQVVASTPDSALATDPASAKTDPAAEAAAREKRLARKRLEEIRLENAAIAQRQKDELIQRLLAAAKSAYAVGAFTHPEGDSAADRYREILKLRPNQPEAVAGLQHIADVFVEEARHARSVGDAAALRKLVAKVTQLNPNHRVLPELQTALGALESSGSSHSRREAADLDRVSRYIAKSYWYLDRKPFDLRAADSATNQYDLAAALVPMAPGLPSLKERIISAYPVAVRAELAGKDTKRALRVISNARKRNWISSELEELEISITQARPAETLGAK